VTGAAAIRRHLDVVPHTFGQPIGQVAQRDRRAGRDRNVAAAKEFVRLAPIPHLGECILTHHEYEFALGLAFLQRAKGVDEIRRPRAVHLYGVDRKVRVVLHGEPRPLQTHLCRRDHVVFARAFAHALVHPPAHALVGWDGGWDEEHALEIERLDHFLRRAKVTLVDWIEGAAVEADHPRSWPSPWMTNFFVVRPSSPIGP